MKQKEQDYKEPQEPIIKKDQKLYLVGDDDSMNNMFSILPSKDIDEINEDDYVFEIKILKKLKLKKTLIETK